MNGRGWVNSKERAQRIHAKRRFMERYGISFNRHMRRLFVGLIQGSRCRLVERQSNRISVWDVPYDGQVFRVVYDRHRKNVVTVLPDNRQGR